MAHTWVIWCICLLPRSLCGTFSTNESCYPYVGVIPHARVSLSHMYEWVMSHVWMSHVPCMNESYRNESYHTQEWVMPHSHSYLQHDSFIRAIRLIAVWLIHTWDMTHSYRGRDSFIHGTWLIHTGDKTHCGVTYSYMGHDSFIQGTWLIHTWDMTHSYGR